MLLIELIFLTLLLILVILIIVCLLAYLYSLMVTRAPFIPLPQGKVAAVIETLALKPGSVFYDLGSGEGRIVFAAARAQPLAHCIGIEKAFVPTLLALVLRHRYQLERTVTFSKKNFFRLKLNDATHVFCYLMPGMMADMEDKFQKELSPGAKVVSCDFALPHRKPAEIIALTGGSLGKKLYVYEY